MSSAPEEIHQVQILRENATTTTTTTTTTATTTITTQKTTLVKPEETDETETQPHKKPVKLVDLIEDNSASNNETRPHFRPRTTATTTTITSPFNTKKMFTPLDNRKGANLQHFKLESHPELGIHWHPYANMITHRQQYAVMVSNYPQADRPITYAFNLPLSCMMWREIGYGCLIVLTYREKDEEVRAGMEVIYKHVIEWGKDHPGQVVILELQIFEGTPREFTEVAQVCRLFMAHMFKYSLQPEEYQAIQDVYLITTDADLFPISSRIYHDHAHDINMVNPINVGAKNDKLYAALSCIGATVGVWDSLIPKEKFYHVKYFNAEGIIKVCQYEKEDFRQKNPTKGVNPEWYIDQIYASRLMLDYIHKHPLSWEAIHQRERKIGLDPSLRVDRTQHETKSWARNSDQSLVKHPYKDSHICRDSYTNHCWWDIAQVLKPRLTVKHYQAVLRYRSEFIDVLSRSKTLGTGHDRHVLHQENNKRHMVLNKTNGFLDIRNMRSQFYPKIYKNDKPLQIDWDKERVFLRNVTYVPPPPKPGKEIKIKKNQVIRNFTETYYVIPNNVELFEQVEKRFFCRDLDSKKSGAQCKEIKFERRK